MTDEAVPHSVSCSLRPWAGVTCARSRAQTERPNKTQTDHTLCVMSSCMGTHTVARPSSQWILCRSITVARNCETPTLGHGVRIGCRKCRHGAKILHVDYNSTSLCLWCGFGLALRLTLSLLPAPNFWPSESPHLCIGTVTVPSTGTPSTETVISFFAES